MKEKSTRRIGKEREEQAVQYLREQGYHILTQNYGNRFAELDVVAREDAYLCFIEVKYRKNDRYGAPEGVISGKKIHNICKASEFYMRENRISPDTPVRYDVVLIIGEEIRLIRDAFSYVR